MTASKDAKLIAVTMAMGFGVLVLTLFQIFAPDADPLFVVTATVLPVVAGATADWIGFADRSSLDEREEVPE